MAENGACEGKFEIAKMAKQNNLDAIHDTVHESHGTRHATAEPSRASLTDILSDSIRKKEQGKGPVLFFPYACVISKNTVKLK